MLPPVFQVSSGVAFNWPPSSLQKPEVSEKCCNQIFVSSNSPTHLKCFQEAGPQAPAYYDLTPQKHQWWSFSGQLGQRLNMCWDSLQHYSNKDFLGLSLEALQMPCKWFSIWYHSKCASSQNLPFVELHWACNSKKEWSGENSTLLRTLAFSSFISACLFLSSMKRHGSMEISEFCNAQSQKPPQKKLESVGRSTWNEGKISWVSWKLPKSLLLQILWIHWMGKTLQMHQSNSVKGAGSTFESGTTNRFSPTEDCTHEIVDEKENWLRTTTLNSSRQSQTRSGPFMYCFLLQKSFSSCDAGCIQFLQESAPLPGFGEIPNAGWSLRPSHVAPVTGGTWESTNLAATPWECSVRFKLWGAGRWFKPSRCPRKALAKSSSLECGQYGERSLPNLQ